MRDAANESERAFHDAMQYAVKILMNSFYGVFASGFYRFTHRDLGSSITAWARHNIKAVIADLEDQGHPVVYSDTDSIFVKSPIEADVPGAVPAQARKDAEEGDAEAKLTVERWEAAKDAMVAFGLDLADRYSRDAAVWNSKKASPSSFLTAPRSGTSVRWSGRRKTCSSAATRPNGPIPSPSWWRACTRSWSMPWPTKAKPWSPTRSNR